MSNATSNGDENRFDPPRTDSNPGNATPPGRPVAGTLPDHEKIGLLFGLANKKAEKDSCKKDMETVMDNTLKKSAARYEIAIGKYREALTQAKEIEQQMGLMTEKLLKTRQEVLKNLKDAILYVLPSDFSSEKKQEIVDKVLEANVQTIASLQLQVQRIADRLNAHINALTEGNFPEDLKRTFQQECQSIQAWHSELQKIEKGFGAGHSIYLNTTPPKS
mgnify:CR=1 FL=1